MRITEGQLRQIIREELTEATLAEPEDRAFGRALKQAFRRAGGQSALRGVRTIYWQKKPEGIIENLNHPSGEIGCSAYLPDDPVRPTFKNSRRTGAMWSRGFGPMGLEVRGQIVLAAFDDLRTGSSVPRYDAPERFSDPKARRDYRKYPSTDLYFGWSALPDEGWLGRGINTMDNDELIDHLNHQEGDELAKDLEDLGIITQLDQIEPGAFTEIIVAHPRPVALWLADDALPAPELAEVVRTRGIPIKRYGA